LEAVGEWKVRKFRQILQRGACRIYENQVFGPQGLSRTRPTRPIHMIVLGVGDMPWDREAVERLGESAISVENLLQYRKEHPPWPKEPAFSMHLTDLYAPPLANKLMGKTVKFTQNPNVLQLLMEMMTLRDFVEKRNLLHDKTENHSMQFRVPDEAKDRDLYAKHRGKAGAMLLFENGENTEKIDAEGLQLCSARTTARSSPRPPLQQLPHEGSSLNAQKQLLR